MDEKVGHWHISVKQDQALVWGVAIKEHVTGYALIEIVGMTKTEAANLLANAVEALSK